MMVLPYVCIWVSYHLTSIWLEYAFGASTILNGLHNHSCAVWDIYRSSLLGPAQAPQDRTLPPSLISVGNGLPAPRIGIAASGLKLVH